MTIKITAILGDGQQALLQRIMSAAIDYNIAKAGGPAVKARRKPNRNAIGLKPAIMQHYTPQGEFHQEQAQKWIVEHGYSPNSWSSTVCDLVDEGYLREVAMEPWGGTFGYWSDGSHVVVASTGPNQRFDLEYGVLAQVHAVSQLEQLCAAMSPSNDDYVFIDGNECPQDI